MPLICVGGPFKNLEIVKNPPNVSGCVNEIFLHVCLSALKSLKVQLQ